MTLSQTWIVAYLPDGRPQTVESGWQVWHGWGTEYAVPFIYFTADGYERTGCYNVSTSCNQFVLVSSRPVLGVPVPLTSTEGGQQGAMEIVWFLKDGNWWLKLDGEWLGYYPASTFANGPIVSGGQVIDVGGEATGWKHTSEMGSGRFAREGYRRAAFVSGIGYYDQSSRLVQLSPNNNILQASAELPSCYELVFNPNPPQSESPGLSFFMGGPGENHFGVYPAASPGAASPSGCYGNQ